MKISPVNFSYNNFRTVSKNQSKTDAVKGSDVVSFGQRQYYKYNNNSVYKNKIKLSELKNRLQIQLDKEAGRKNNYTQDRQRQMSLLRKKFVTKEMQKDILENKIDEKMQAKIITKLLPYPELLSELFLEPAGGGLMLSVSDKNMRKICSGLRSYEYFAKLALSKDKNGRGFIDKASASKIKIFNEQAKRYPELLAVLYTTQRSRKRLPAHFLPPDALDSMYKVLQNNPELIKKIMTATDVYGNTPAHNRFSYGQYVIANYLAEQIPTAEIVYKHVNKFGEYFDHAYEKAEKYVGPYEKTWKFIYENF